jgi:outer membrane protein assembly factor BamB
MKAIRTLSLATLAMFAILSYAAADWPMWGGTPGRNMVSDAKNVSIDFDLQAGKEGRVLWQQGLGSQTYGNPIVADGKLFVGTNNGGGWRKDKYPPEVDLGVLLCFAEEDGEFMWQLSREKLAAGRVNDWLLQGICSAPAVEGNRMWVVTNRCELMCLDTNGFRDGKNDGDVKDEVDATKEDADIIWNLDMIEELGVFPHNLATSSPVVVGDMVYVVTSNGVDEAHLNVPAPRSPCFLAVNKNTGKVVWEHNQPFDGILHGQWSSPSVGVVDGKTQIIFPGGDGWVYAHDAISGDEIWKCDLNPKETKWELYGKGTRNSIISTPVFHDNSVLIAVGQDPEHGEGVGYLWRIDATKKGDVSAEVGEIGTEGKPNPNSGVIWSYGGEVQPTLVEPERLQELESMLADLAKLEGQRGSGTPDYEAFMNKYKDSFGKPMLHENFLEKDLSPEREAVYRRTMSTVAVADGLVFAADLSGFVHCIDLESGKRHWEYDMLSGVWGSPLVADGKVFIGNEDGTLTIFKASPRRAEVLAKKETVNFSAIYSTPTFANGKMYLSDRARLYAVDVTEKPEKEEK